jgi:hypothetical protein
MSSDIQSTFIQPDAASAVSVVAEARPASFAATLANSSAATASALGNNPFSAVEGSPTITVTDPNISNYSVGQTVELTGDAGHSVTIAGTYTVKSINTVSGTFTVTNSGNASVADPTANTFGGSSATATYPQTTLDVSRNITVFSASDDTDKTFTVFGTTANGTVISETATGGNNGTITGTTIFAKIIGVEFSARPAGNIKVGTGTSVAVSMFNGDMRLRGLYMVNNTTAATISFKSGSETGTTEMQFRTCNAANTTQYPDIPDDGIVFRGGGYVVFTVGDFVAMTVFYA